MRTGRGRLVVMAGVGAALAGASARAEPVFTTSFGIEFATIGAPGNRPATPQEAPRFFPPYWNPVGINVGHVDYEFRLSRTEITVGQYLEFVRAYAPYWAGHPDAGALVGSWIFYQGNGTYVAYPGTENLAANMSWYNAARFCNWLHNGKSSEPWAFEDGAYDTSTFQPGPGGVEQATRHPDARFWIPSLDEWTKGMHYDPDRYGPGEEGYWTYPNSGNTVSVGGYPSQGGQTSAGIPFTGNPAGWVPVGSYPDVRSPWGLLDGSGGESEWTELQGFSNTRSSRGSEAFNEFYQPWDEIDFLGGSFANFPVSGIRLATVVPEPGVMMVAFLAFLSETRRKR